MYCNVCDHQIILKSGRKYSGMGDKIMKFAIWGTGQKGRISFDVLGMERVSCFIDSKKNIQGKSVQGCPVVSFEDYLKEYQDSLIIVSMLDCKAVIGELNDNGIPYLLWETTSGILENKYIGLDDCLDVVEKYIGCDYGALWGVNLLSIVLYDYLASDNRKLSFLSYGVGETLRNYLEVHGYIFDSLSADRIVVTDDGWKDAVVEYPNIKIANIRNLFLEKSYEEYNGLVKFKGLHNNRRCFLIGNGPSLKLEDLDKLYQYGDICFATNMIYKIFSKTKWRPDYYVASDMAVLEKYGEQIKQIDISCAFIGNRRTGFWDGFDDSKFHVFNDYRCLEMDIPSFSDDITYCVYSYYTVMYSCLQIAIYMGFNEIYLLGVDANYNGYASDVNNHFTDNYYDKSDRQRIPVDIIKHFRAYQVAEHYAMEHGVKIYNATRGGKLEVFERVNFDSLF